MILMTDDVTHLVPSKALFAVSEAAAILGVCHMTIYRWIEDGTLIPHLNIKPYRIRRDSLVKLLSP